MIKPKENERDPVRQMPLSFSAQYLIMPYWFYSLEVSLSSTNTPPESITQSVNIRMKEGMGVG